MLNQVVLVGRIVDNLELPTKKEEKASELTLAIQQTIKNEEGIYETDFIKVLLLNMISQNTLEYCKKGDIVGIKGRIATQEDKLRVIADRVTFLSSK